MEDYSVRILTFPHRLSVSCEGVTLADTRRALKIVETGHRDVFYLPAEDIRMDLLRASTHSTHCPFKGDASYWSLASGDRLIENLAWSYENPLEAMLGIKGYLSFYPDLATITIADSAAD